MIRLLAVFLVLNLTMLALELPRYAGFGPNWLALEALAVTGLFAVLPAARWRRWPAWLAGVLMLLLIMLTLMDTLSRLSLNRPLNVYLDHPLIASVYHLIAGNVSVAAAVLATVLLLAALLGCALGVRQLLYRLNPPTSPLPTSARAAGLVMLLIGASWLTAGNHLPSVPRTITPALTLVQDQAHWAVRTHRESRAFEAMLKQRPRRTDSPLTGLADVDVIIGFVESYGVSAVFDGRYAPVVSPRLEDMEQAVADAGLHMVTGTLNAPTFGGQSWLSHATLLTGLWIDSHLRYELLLGSERNSLVDDLAATGHRTEAVMPAITRPWPEGRWYGFHRIFEAKDIPYAGPPFNWVTMPDQFTWSFFQETVRPDGERPVFAKLALVSSHAPWVPILPVLEDWNAIGDGRVFRQWEGAGEAPESLWRDHDRVREHYARSVGYSIGVATRYAERFVDDRTLLVVLGDHQPARLITGPEPSAGVPVHVISGDPTLLEPFRARGFMPGAMPPVEFTDQRLDAFRRWLQEDFGDGGR